MNEFKEQLREYAEEFNMAFESFLDEYFEGDNTKLAEIIRYAADGGKRLRPIMMFMAADAAACLYGGEADPEKLLAFQSAIELIHNFSLVHDDLPGMDNDLTRHGKPSVHAKFGEAAAILAGDAMLNMAHEIMLKNIMYPEEQYAVSVINSAAKEMIVGQCMDMKIENAPETPEGTDIIYNKKTGALFSAALVAGASLAEAEEDFVKAMYVFGYIFGRVFQLTDDLLDGEFKNREELLAKISAETQIGIGVLAPFGDFAKDLINLINYLTHRIN